MTVYARLKVSGVVFDPKPAADAVEGELFTDSAAPTDISVGGAGGTANPLSTAANPLQKQMQNLSGADIADGELVAKMPNGSIAAASSDVSGRGNVIGEARGIIVDGAIGTVGLLGPNLDGAITGRGFAPGDKIYMAESTGAYTNNLASFTGSNDRIVRVGIADCAAGAASATATDLLCILTEEVADVV